MKKLKEQKIEKVELLAINECKSAPFNMAKLSNGKISVICGKVKYDTEFEEFEDCENWVNSRPWELMGLLIEAYTEFLKSNINNKNN